MTYSLPSRTYKQHKQERPPLDEVLTCPLDDLLPSLSDLRTTQTDQEGLKRAKHQPKLSPNYEGYNPQNCPGFIATVTIGRATVGSGCHSTNPNPNYGRKLVGEGECLMERWWEKEEVWMKRVGTGGGDGVDDKGMGRRRRSRCSGKKSGVCIVGSYASALYRSGLGLRCNLGSCAVREGVSREWEAPPIGMVWR
jgi:hypothetical protein